MSPAWAIEFLQTSKTFGKRRRQVRAVRDLSLQIAPGQVFGFLGPNGAGKSTSIRMLMDLVRPTSGLVKVFDRPVNSDNSILAEKVGALVEGATFYNYLTGRRNLEVLARTHASYDPKRIETLLKQVGLLERADRKVAGYSTGMKQRLGIAAALLHDPELVILDEPTNGLDPGGIQEIRAFIRELVDKQDKTVFLSSHMLGEVEQVCDRVAIIDQGQLIREDSVASMLSDDYLLKLEVAPVAAAMLLLAPYSPNLVSDEQITISVERSQTPEILRQLLDANINVYQVTEVRQRLEDVFLDAVQEGADA